jgi:hypothetical protein
VQLAGQGDAFIDHPKVAFAARLAELEPDLERAEPDRDP